MPPIKIPQKILIKRMTIDVDQWTDDHPIPPRVTDPVQRVQCYWHQFIRDRESCPINGICIDHGWPLDPTQWYWHRPKSGRIHGPYTTYQQALQSLLDTLKVVQARRSTQQPAVSLDGLTPTTLDTLIANWHQSDQVSKPILRGGL